MLQSEIIRKTDQHLMRFMRLSPREYEYVCDGRELENSIERALATRHRWSHRTLIKRKI